MARATFAPCTPAPAPGLPGQGLLDEAIVHALQAEDPLRAASLVEDHVHQALDREDWRQLERWIGLLPAAMLGRPRLLLAQAWLSFIRYQLPAIVPLLDSAEAALARETAQSSEQPDATLLGEIATLRAALAYSANDAVTAVRWAADGMQLLRPEMQYVTGLANFYYLSGLQAAGQPAAASEFARQQLAIHGQYPSLILRVFLALCNIHHEMADLSSLQSAATLFQQVAQREGFGLSVAWAAYAQSWLHYQRNELAAAEQGFRRLEAIVSHGRTTLDSFTGLALTLLAQGHPDQALAAVAALHTRLLERGMLALAPLAESLQQRVLLASDPAAALARGYRAPQAPISMEFWEQPALTQVRTLLASGAVHELAQAEELLADRRVQAVARHSLRSLIEIDALHALVLAARGDETAALAALRQRRRAGRAGRRAASAGGLRPRSGRPAGKAGRRRRGSGLRAPGAGSPGRSAFPCSSASPDRRPAGPPRPGVNRPDHQDRRRDRIADQPRDGRAAAAGRAPDRQGNRRASRCSAGDGQEAHPPHLPQAGGQQPPRRWPRWRASWVCCNRFLQIYFFLGTIQRGVGGLYLVKARRMEFTV